MDLDRSSSCGSISLEDMMNASIAAGERVYQCNCGTTCSTKKCICRANDVDCTQACTCGTKRKTCKNNKPTPEDSDEEDEDDDNSETPSTSTTTPLPRRKRNRDDMDAATTNGRQDIHNERLRLQNMQIENFVEGLNIGDLRQICADLLQRNPGAYVDYIMSEGTDVDVAYDAERLNESQGGNEDPDADQQGGNEDPDEDQQGGVVDQPPSPLRQIPWCTCRRCRQMPTQVEKKCCRPRRGQECISLTGEFARLCLDNMVLEVAMRANEDIMAENAVRNNAAYRHAAYRTYIYWQHGRLGVGNRRVIPSCAVWKIRTMWPDPLGVYKGYIEGVGHLGD